MRVRSRHPLAWVLCPAMAILLCSCGGNGGKGLVDDDGDDGTPPRGVTDLSVTAVTPASATLRWTAPAAGDGTEVVYGYDLRHAAAPIDETTWALATQAPNEPAPLPPGMTQTMTVGSLTPAHTYHFALKSRDAMGAWSVLSNLASAVLSEETEVVFPDSALQSIIRGIIQKPTGPIHLSDVAGITEIRADSAGIANLTGIESCGALRTLTLATSRIGDLGPLARLTNLMELDLRDNQVTSLQPLAGLTTLTQLGLSENLLTDLSPLSGLTNLTTLAFGNNRIADLGPLASLTHLDILYLNGNQITDIQPLAGLTSLTNLLLSANQISDLTPIEGLTNLQNLFLDLNQISDLAPLVANPGLGSGDTIGVRWNPLSATAVQTQVPALEARGATVLR